MNKFKQNFVSPRIKSQNCISMANFNDQNVPNFEIKRQCIAPPKYKCLSSSKSFEGQQKHKSLRNQLNLRGYKNGNLNQFCEKHVSSLKKQFPTYFQSILNQLKQDGSVQLEKIQDNFIKQQNSVQLTSFNNECKSIQLQQDNQQPLMEIKNKQNLSLTNSNDQKLKQHLSEINKDSFNPYQESNIVSKSSFQLIHQRFKLQKMQNLNFQEIHETFHKQFNKIAQDKLQNYLNYHQNSDNKSQYKSESEDIIQNQIQTICQKHISRLNRIIEQVGNIKNQLLSDVKQVIKHSRSKSKQLKDDVNRLNKYKNKQFQTQKIMFPKVPKVLTLQLLRKQLNKNGEQAQQVNKQNQNIQIQNLYYEDQTKYKRKRRSSPLKKIKFAEQNKQLNQKQLFIINKIQQFQVQQQPNAISQHTPQLQNILELNVQLNLSNQISFKFSSEKNKQNQLQFKNNQNQLQSQNNQNQLESNLQNLIFSQSVNSSCTSQKVPKVLTKRFRKRYNKYQNYNSGNQILISDPQNQIHASDSENPQTLSKKSSWFYNRKSIYIHRGDSIDQCSSMNLNSFKARLSSNQEKILDQHLNYQQQSICHSLFQQQPFISQTHNQSYQQNHFILNNINGDISFQRTQRTKIDYQYSQSQLEGLSKVQQSQKQGVNLNNYFSDHIQSFEYPFQNIIIQTNCNQLKIQEQARDYLNTEFNDNFQFKITNIYNNEQCLDKDSMLLSSYDQYTKRTENYAIINKQLKQKNKICKSNKAQEEKSDINLKQNCQNSEICTQIIYTDLKKQQNSFFSQSYKQNLNTFTQELFNSSFQKVQDLTDKSYLGISSTNISITPPNIKKVKQRVLQYKKVKQQKVKNENEGNKSEKLQFNKNMQVFHSSRKLKFKKVQQKKKNSKQDLEKRMLIDGNMKPLQQYQKVEDSHRNNQQNENKESKMEVKQPNQQNLISYKKSIQVQEFVDQESQIQIQRESKNKNCIYYQSRKKEVYKYPWLKFK